MKHTLQASEKVWSNPLQQLPSPSSEFGSCDNLAPPRDYCGRGHSHAQEKNASHALTKPSERLDVPAAGGGELSSGSYFVSPLDQSEAGASTQDSLTHSRADLLFLRASLRLKFHWEVSDALRLPTGIAARNVSDSEGPAPSMAAWGTTAAVPCRPLLPACGTESSAWWS